MIIRIDPAGAATPAEQLIAQIAALIDRGELQVGERLPTIRGLAADLGLAPGTVARAYAELERDGWLAAQGRRGTVVAERPLDHQHRPVADVADAFAEAARAAGLDVAAARRLLDLAFARLDLVNQDQPSTRRRTR